MKQKLTQILTEIEPFLQYAPGINNVIETSTPISAAIGISVGIYCANQPYVKKIKCKILEFYDLVEYKTIG